jgi:NADP-dependent 3-hydroxy acid dehydrogenase YdfG
VASLAGKVAWVTGAGSGIGEAAALALAGEGAAVALTGRRREPLQTVADKITKAGGKALVAAADLGELEAANRIAATIAKDFGRLDILVNNAGSNVLERSWAQLTPERAKTVLDANLNSAFYCSVAALHIMRPQKDGLLIHTASWAGRFVGLVSGASYSAAKHGVVAMSYSINMEEFQNGIRSTVLCPAEVATPILDKRPKPVTAEERARMIQPQNMADLIVYIAKQPASICVNEVVISPTWNRGYAHAAGIGPSRT